MFRNEDAFTSILVVGLQEQALGVAAIELRGERYSAILENSTIENYYGQRNK
jgi:hypothetical protein